MIKIKFRKTMFSKSSAKETFPIKFKTRYTTKKTYDKDMAITTAFSDNTLKRLFHYLPKNKMQLLVNQIYMETLLKL